MALQMTTLFLEAAQHRKLKRLAAKLGVSMGEIVRHLVAEYLRAGSFSPFRK